MYIYILTYQKIITITEEQEEEVGWGGLIKNYFDNFIMFMYFLQCLKNLLFNYYAI